MSLRRFLNVSWSHMVKDLEEDGKVEVERVLNSPPQTPAQEAEAERRRRARENKAAVSDLAKAFSLGR